MKPFGQANGGGSLGVMLAGETAKFNAIQTIVATRTKHTNRGSLTRALHRSTSFAAVGSVRGDRRGTSLSPRPCLRCVSRIGVLPTSPERLGDAPFLTGVPNRSKTSLNRRSAVRRRFLPNPSSAGSHGQDGNGQRRVASASSRRERGQAALQQDAQGRASAEDDPDPMRLSRRPQKGELSASPVPAPARARRAKQAIGAVDHDRDPPYADQRSDLRGSETLPDLGGDHFDRRAKTAQTKRLVTRLQSLGYNVLLSQAPTSTNAASF